MKTPSYPPIADYALLSDCHCNALVSRQGSVDWCCMPRVDDDSCFGRLLDWERGGHFSIAPAGEVTHSRRRYLDGCMILETGFTAEQGEVKLTDFYAMDTDASDPARYHLVRLIDGVAGEVEMRVEIRPRFDYGEIIPRVQRHGDSVYTAHGSNQGLIIYADVPLDVIEHKDLVASFTVRAGQRVRAALRFEYPELIEEMVARMAASGEHVAPALDAAFEQTRRWWTDWSSRMHGQRQPDAQTMRSVLVLKALTYERTGAIVAASTTSLPEWMGGERNWDYRFSWVRDSVFAVRVLHELGYTREADRFHQFIQRSSAGSAAQLQIMYGVDGKRRLPEVKLDWLEGYRGSRPVRVGNAAARQVQFDIYGDLLEMAWEWHRSGHEIEADYWDFLADVVNTVCHRWPEPDHGIWEVRGQTRHYVYSKAMCWAALNRGIQLVETGNYEAPVDRWRENRDEIRAAIEERGYDKERGVFVQSFDSRELDAALLILPRIDFVRYDDARMLRTAQAIIEDLERDGLLLRYRGDDGLEGPEGTFLPCTFWLVDCLACQGKTDEARVYYERALACGNELGLFSEEYDPGAGQMLGNFPQGLTHVSQIMAWLALKETEKP